MTDCDRRDFRRARISASVGRTWGVPGAVWAPGDRMSPCPPGSGVAGVGAATGASGRDRHGSVLPAVTLISTASGFFAGCFPSPEYGVGSNPSGARSGASEAMVSSDCHFLDCFSRYAISSL